VRLLHPSPITALFAGLFDDAALFPPSSASMPAAVAAHGEHGRSWYGNLVGLFVCPAGRLGELDSAAQHARFGDVNIALTVPDGPAAVADARADASEYGWLHVKAIEVPASAAELESVVEAFGDHRSPATYVEIPVKDVTDEVAATLNRAGLGLKLRTGGTTEDAHPSTAELAGALTSASASDVRFKCTAGLHHAIRHADAETGLPYHGFLNVLWAIQLLQSGREPEAAEAALACTDRETVARAVRDFDNEQTTRLRRRFASIGSCSIAEPVADLVALGQVIPP
jgi:hypothetical protein